MPGQWAYVDSFCAWHASSVISQVFKKFTEGLRQKKSDGEVKRNFPERSEGPSDISSGLF